MTRAAVFCAVIGLAAASVGCRNTITGTHDCTYDPSTVALPALDGKQNYAAPVGPPVAGVGYVAPPVVDKPADAPKGK